MTGWPFRPQPSRQICETPRVASIYRLVQYSHITTKIQVDKVWASRCRLVQGESRPAGQVDVFAFGVSQAAASAGELVFSGPFTSAGPSPLPPPLPEEGVVGQRSLTCSAGAAHSRWEPLLCSNMHADTSECYDSLNQLAIYFQRCYSACAEDEQASAFEQAIRGVHHLGRPLLQAARSKVLRQPAAGGRPRCPVGAGAQWISAPGRLTGARCGSPTGLDLHCFLMQPVYPSLVFRIAKDKKHHMMVNPKIWLRSANQNNTISFQRYWRAP